MDSVIPGRWRAERDGDFVLFLIGMRINTWWRIDQWLPVARAMPAMIRELEERPELGFLGATTFFGRTICMLQYWRSEAALLAYARGKDYAHVPAWRAFNKRAQSSSAVGVWHETYPVFAGRYENVYVDMPPLGLGAVSARKPAGRSTGKGATAAAEEAPHVAR